MSRGTLRDRMNKAGPLWKAMATRFDQIITALNELRSLVVVGQNPHKVNDTTNVPTVAIAVDALDEVVDLSQNLITKYEAHIGSTTHHLAADSTNVVTELGVAIEVYTLVNELKADLNAHMQDGVAHTNDDDVTAQVASADADTKAKAITLVNEIRASYEAHRQQLVDAGAAAVHGAADATNVVTLTAVGVSATWSEIAALADEIRTDYEAHRVLTAGTVHANADSTHVISASAVGSVQTAVNAGLNELKADFNAHVAEFGTSHAIKDSSVTVSAANASSLATSLTLVNAIRSAFADHLTRSDEFSAIGSLDLEE